jgi:transcriptional regulator with XRE-family HTH domain
VIEISSENFAAAFGDSLRAFLLKKNIDFSEAARRLGVERETLYTYWKDTNGKRRSPRVELLFRACVEFEFEFDYDGYRVSATSLIKPKKITPKRVPEQIPFNFEREFNLTEDETDETGVRVHFKREPGRVEFSVSLKAAS